ncbi:hypothetical protein CHISP_1480 [Chitinispirillum alkaliphilum]|nr:hypothetical protein CHISP_1480 [Chitinispirillum alkaliphilum]
MRKISNTLSLSLFIVTVFSMVTATTTFPFFHTDCGIFDIPQPSVHDHTEHTCEHFDHSHETDHEQDHEVETAHICSACKWQSKHRLAETSCLYDINISSPEFKISTECQIHLTYNFYYSLSPRAPPLYV